MPNLFIISLGGSLIVPEEIDVKFLKAFQKLISGHVNKRSRFILIVGGGRAARNYTAALRAVAKPGTDDLDWLGIQATWLNAKLVQLMFGKKAHPVVISDPNKKVSFREKILVAGGWMPGRSTDDDAVRLAKVYGGQTIINLSNIDYVYTKDPRKHPEAKKIEHTNWSDFRKIVGSTWDPGANVPFDPTAAKFAQKNRLRVIIANGRNLSNLQNILRGKRFQGTVIE